MLTNFQKSIWTNVTDNNPRRLRQKKGIGNPQTISISFNQELTRNIRYMTDL